MKQRSMMLGIRLHCSVDAGWYIYLYCPNVYADIFSLVSDNHTRASRKSYDVERRRAATMMSVMTFLFLDQLSAPRGLLANNSHSH
eukprot:1190885-Prorocentrum_minimum.AAC.4